jgi:cell division protein FtsI (penicillin-binding protein 3)
LEVGSRKQKIRFYNKRFYLILFCFVVLLLVLLARMVQLTVFDRSFLQKQGKLRSVHLIDTPSFRGMLLDRNGVPLAVSTPVDSVWANPQDLGQDDQKLAELSQLLAIPLSDLKKRLYLYRKKQFVYLKKELTPREAAKIKEHLIPGVYLKRSYKRYYPEGEVLSQLLGYTNVNDQGQEGLELAYNQWLDGVPGKQMVVEDLMGNVVADLQQVQVQQPGHNLTLSIDRRIQFQAYQALKDAVVHFKAASGSVVVLDSKSGEVLAAANVPAYNPNDRKGHYSSSYRNRAFTDVFEPGSTLKAFSVMSALDSGKYTPETKIDTAPGWFRVGKNWVRDEINNKELTVTQVLQKSSNVGVTKMTLSLPPEQLYHLLARVGFGEITASGFPGESAGRLINHRKWRPFTLATLAFGYGISVTTLQLAHAYGIIANDGALVPITLLKHKHAVQGKQVLDKRVAREMLTMLASVVAPGGTGRRAAVQGYQVAGKTGTARIAGVNGYKDHQYVGSFVGLAPVSAPRIVVAVVIVKPEGKVYYGGLVAAPAFAKVMGSALRILNIAPDDINATS